MVDKDSVNFQAFRRGYYEAMLWASSDEDGENFDQYDIWDIDEAQVQAHDLELISFYNDNEKDLEIYRQEYKEDLACAGHDFYLTRNGHGAGFWDRGSHPVFRRLSDASHAYGECMVYLGDDQRLYIE